MIAHLSIGVRDLERSKGFYDSALAPLGYRCLRPGRAPSAEAVDAFHAAALRAGGQDNGAPGPRPIYGPDYYAAFIIDPDGYRIEAHYGPPET